MLKDGEKGVILQRDKETYAVAPHLPCGVVTPETLRKLADVAETRVAALKVTSAARIALIGLKEEDVDAVWQDLQMSPGAAIGVCVRSIKACPGTLYCRLGKQDSLGVGLHLDEKYHGMELPGRLKIGVSGCPNQCAETAIKDIGLVGYPKGWKLLVGGAAGNRPRLGQELAAELTTERALELVDKILEYYKANATKHKRLGVMIDKMGFEEFRKAILD